MEEYIVTANELVAFAQFLATTQPYTSFITLISCFEIFPTTLIGWNGNG
jgi:hypothetical protein